MNLPFLVAVVVSCLTAANGNVLEAWTDNAVLGETATKISFRFTLGSTGTLSTFNISETSGKQVWNSYGLTTCNLYNGTDTHEHTAFASDVSISVEYDNIEITPLNQMAAGFEFTLECIDNIAPNPTVATMYTFKLTNTLPDEETTAATFSVGSPRIYFLRSECRTGGLAGGLLVGNNNEDPIKTCATGKSFVVVSGLQHHGGDKGTCANGETDKNRCDALYHTDSSVDIAVSTSGSHGTLECGALTKGSTAPTLSLSNLVDSDSNVKSANSVFVSDADKEKDQVVTLFGLTNDLQYDIYCHMDDVYMSPVLTVWTDLNTRLWGDSLIPGVKTRNENPSTITLTFSHGAALETGDLIVLTTVVDDDNSALFTNSPAPDCKATTNGNTLALSGAAGTGAQTGYNTQALTGSNKVLTITLAAGSAKGSEVVIVCNTGLSDNEDAVYTTSYKLETTDNDDSTSPSASNTARNTPLLNRFGWKTL